MDERAAGLVAGNPGHADNPRHDGKSRRYLMLMGPSSPLWRELALALEADGAKVVKVCFSLGDWLYWRRKAVHFRGWLSRWPAFLDRLIAKEGITDILYYADRNPYHVAAGELARARGLVAIAFENGYLRPDWITVERGGMGVYSHFPNDPAAIRAAAASLPEPDMTPRYRHGFWTEMVHEETYQLRTYSWRVFYPFYRSGKYYDPLFELLVSLPKLAGGRAREAKAVQVVQRLCEGAAPFFVVALQLQGDYQIRANSPFTHIGEMIERVIASFARKAAPEARLVFKQHPHDNGWENWPKRIAANAARHGVADRVDFIDGGNLNSLFEKARGCVIINSTVGLAALQAGCPTKVLGIAIYDLAGMTHQGDLDGFWQAPQPVDASLVAAFIRLLAATIQIRGSFYDPAGRQAAIAEAVARLREGRVNEPGAYIDPPPRYAQARALGVPLETTSGV